MPPIASAPSVARIASRRDADFAVVRPLEYNEARVARDLLLEARAAQAHDAPLAIEDDALREGIPLGEVALLLTEPARAEAPGEGDVLQGALAALVADRAV